MPRPVQLLVAILAVIALVGTVVFVVTFAGVGHSDRASIGSAVAAPSAVSTTAAPTTDARCPSGEPVVIAADPSIAPAVDAVVDTLSEDDLDCATVTVDSRDPARALDDITHGHVPDLWIPDSGRWLDKLAVGQGTVPVTNSVASSPVVLASGSDTEIPADWVDVLGMSGLHLGDPLSSAVSGAPVVAAVAQTQTQAGDADAVSVAMVHLAQARFGNSTSAEAAARLDAAEALGGTAVVTEQAFGAYLTAHPDSGLSEQVPESGTVFMDYPLVVTGAPAEDKSAVARALAGALSGDSGRNILRGFGFRGPDRGAPEGGGVGAVPALVPTDTSAVTAALAQYAALSRPSRALAVIDVSGSMNYLEDGVTRIAAGAQAGDIAVRMMPANTQLGLWAFSVNLGPGTDYRELEPILRLDAVQGESDHRVKLLQQIDALPSMVGGGTGLYDSVLAAYRAVQQGYDPTSTNSVILLTDGANDDPVGISRRELLDALAREHDPARPVPIITIGVSDDADTDVLEQISSITGGDSHFAPTPADIPRVFISAITGSFG